MSPEEIESLDRKKGRCATSLAALSRMLSADTVEGSEIDAAFEELKQQVKIYNEMRASCAARETGPALFGFNKRWPEIPDSQIEALQLKVAEKKEAPAKIAVDAKQARLDDDYKLNELAEMRVKVQDILSPIEKKVNERDVSGINPELLREAHKVAAGVLDKYRGNNAIASSVAFRELEEKTNMLGGVCKLLQANGRKMKK